MPKAFLLAETEAHVMSRFRDMGKCASKYIQIYIKNEYRPLFFAADARYSFRIVKCAFVRAGSEPCTMLCVVVPPVARLILYLFVLDSGSWYCKSTFIRAVFPPLKNTSGFTWYTPIFLRCKKLLSISACSVLDTV